MADAATRLDEISCGAANPEIGEAVTGVTDPHDCVDNSRRT